MKITETEMRGLITGKAMPADIFVGESLAAYLVRKFTNLQKERDALAAENAALAAAFTEDVTTDATDVFSDTVVINHDWDESGSWSYVDNETEVIRAVLDVIRPGTPATDAYLNSVRADGIELLAVNLATPNHELADGTNRINKAVAWYARQFAAQLRAGKDGE